MFSAIRGVVFAALIQIFTTGAGHATEWNVHGSEGLDAVLFVGVLSGDMLQAHIYEKQVADFKPRLPENTVEAIDDLATRITDEGKLFGPLMVLYASAGPLQTLSDVRASMERPENLRPALEASPYWDEERWTWFVNDAAPVMAGILRALETAGFREWYAQEITSDLESDIETFQREATNYDVVSEQSRFLGRPLEPEIEVILVAFSQPYGIKIIGQRFLNYHGYPSAITLRTAAHEMFHPGVDREDPELWALLEPLRKDPFMRNIVDTHDPAFGYNSFEGIVDEDSAQALDQLVSERLGIAHDAARRWQHSDGGMHMLAAALYQAMKEDGFSETGGVYQDWLKLALQRGLLDPDDIIRRATEIVGEVTVQKWLPETGITER